MLIPPFFKDLLGERKIRRKTWNCKLFAPLSLIFMLPVTHLVDIPLVDFIMVMVVTNKVKLVLCWRGQEDIEFFGKMM